MKRSFSLILIILIMSIPLNIYAQRGCCSHHGGVAGCSSNGKQICKDGTLSPTCTCTPVVEEIYGCTDKDAINYNSNADKNDGSCKYHVYGCMDELANNYNPKATISDNSCEYDIYGCTDSNANNYNKDANIDDNSCTYNVYGCTDKTALNYNSLANVDDGSCEYKTITEKYKNENTTSESTVDDENGNSMIGFLSIVGVVAYGIYHYKNNKKQ